jgi:hypothetical protein
MAFDAILIDPLNGMLTIGDQFSLPAMGPSGALKSSRRIAGYAIAPPTGGGEIVKSALLESATERSALLTAFTRTCDEGEFGTVHASVPHDAGMPVAIDVHEPDGVVLYDKSTVFTRFAVHIILCTVPACQFSPPSGERSVNGCVWVIVKSALLESDVAPLLTLTLA